MRCRLLHTDDGPHRTEVFSSPSPRRPLRGPPHDPRHAQLVHCIAGTVSCGPDHQPLDLAPGDTAYFDGTGPHFYAAAPTAAANARHARTPPA